MKKMTAKKFLKKKVLPVFLAFAVLSTGFIIGNYYENDIYAATGTLNSANGTWQGSGQDDNASITVEHTGRYEIRVTGEGAVDGTETKITYGGDLTGRVDLKEGDVLSVRVFKGGAKGQDTDNDNSEGGDAIMVLKNGEPIIGAGGAGGANTLINTINNSLKPNSTTVINNQLFSAGGGGSGCYNGSYYGYGSSGETIEGCTAAKGSGNWQVSPDAGQNYMADYVEFVEMPNGSQTVSFVVKALKPTDEDTAVNIQRIAEAAEKIADNTGSQGQSGVVPEKITVIAGKSFDEYIRGNDSTVGGTQDGVTVINNDYTDGYVRITGVINTAGNKEIIIDGIKYVFKALGEPTSSNVNVILN